MMLMMIQIESVQSRMAFDYFMVDTWRGRGRLRVSLWLCNSA
jgi:hypothetical protein